MQPLQRQKYCELLCLEEHASKHLRRWRMRKTRTFILVKWHFISTQPMRRKLRQDLRACSVLLQPKVWGKKTNKQKTRTCWLLDKEPWKIEKQPQNVNYEFISAAKKPQKTLPENWTDFSNLPLFIPSLENWTDKCYQGPTLPEESVLLCTMGRSPLSPS